MDPPTKGTERDRPSCVQRILRIERRKRALARRSCCGLSWAVGTPAAKESAAMSSCSRRRALGTLLLAALSLDASALHIPPSCGVEALRGGANPLKQCLGLRIRNPFHKLQPPPPPPPPPRKVTFKEKYFKVWTTQLFGPPGGRARTPLALSYSGAVKNLHPCDACGAGD